MKKGGKLADEVARWKRHHNEPPELRAKREEESRKRAERRDAESIGRKHVAFRSEHAELVDDILNFMDVDFGEDSDAMPNGSMSTWQKVASVLFVARKSPSPRGRTSPLWALWSGMHGLHPTQRGSGV